MEKIVAIPNYHLLLENSNKIICASYASKRMLELKMKVPSNKITVCLYALRPSCKPVNTTVKNLNKNKAIHIGIAGRHESYNGQYFTIIITKNIIVLYIILFL